MEGQVHVPVVSETAGEPNCSSYASSETPPVGSQTCYSFSASVEAGLVPHPRRLRLNCPSGGPSHPCKYPWLRLCQPRLAGHSNRGDGTAVKYPFLPFPTDGAGTTVLCGHTPCIFPPKPGTTLTTETAASYSGHLPGLGKSGLGAVGHKHLPGLGEPPSQKFTRHGCNTPVLCLHLGTANHTYHASSSILIIPA